MKQFAKYILVGLLNTSLGYALIFSCMYLLSLGPVISNVIGYGVGMIISYALNRNFTFERQVKCKGAAARFVLVSLLAYSANLVMLLVLIKEAKIHEGISQILAGIVYIVASFMLNKFYVFRVSNDSKV